MRGGIPGIMHPLRIPALCRVNTRRVLFLQEIDRCVDCVSLGVF